MHLIIRQNLDIEPSLKEPTDQGLLEEVANEEVLIVKYDHVQVCWRKAIVEQDDEDEDGNDGEYFIRDWQRL